MTHRLFIGLSLPDDVCDELAALQNGLRGARWRPFDCFHLTLAFIGEVDGAVAEDVADCLSSVNARQFSFTIKGCGQFGDKRPRAVWAAVEPNEALTALQSKVVHAVRRAGAPLDARRFVPHVTLAYLSGADQIDVAAYLERCGATEAGPVAVDGFHLYESKLGSEASVYTILESYFLSPAR